MSKCNTGLSWRHLVIVVLVISCAAPCAFAQTPKTDTTIPRILLVGDSWPWFLWTGFMFWSYENGSAFRDVLPEMGYGRWSDQGEPAIAGSMITQWTRNELTQTPWGQLGKLDFIRRELAEYPTIDIVHLCLGGNDYIRGDFSGKVYHDDGRIYHDFQWQTLIFTGAPTGGTFTLNFQGQTTAPIPYGSDAAVVESALAALSTVGAGNVAVTNTTGTPTYFCEFKGVFGLDDVPLMGCDGSSLTGGSLYISGVKFDHGWKDSWGKESPAEFAFAQTVYDQLEIVARCILNTRPDVHLVICDYDYMDEDIGGASRRDTNMSLINSGRIKRLLADNLRAEPQYANRSYYLNTFGLMQWWFGYPCDFEDVVAPPAEVRRQTTLREDQFYGPKGSAGTKGTIQKPGSFPDYTPWAGGDVDYPSPAIAILYNFGKSGFPEWAANAKGGSNIHLSKEGYLVYARYCVEQYYGAWLDTPKVIAVRRATRNPITPSEVLDPVGLQTVEFEVEFSEPVNGVDEGDFSAIAGNGLAAASIVSVSQGKSGALYTVVVNTGSGSGTLGLSVRDNDSVVAADDATPLAGPLDGTFTYGEKYRVNRSYSLPVGAWPAAILLLLAGARRIATKRSR